jgi:hypothetical protein
MFWSILMNEHIFSKPAALVKSRLALHTAGLSAIRKRGVKRVVSKNPAAVIGAGGSLAAGPRGAMQRVIGDAGYLIT